MKSAGKLATAILLALALAASCGGGDEEARQEEGAGDEVIIGGFGIEGPAGREISVPEATATREAVENYVQSVEPTIESTTRDLSEFVDPSADLQGGMLTFSVEAGAVEEARTTAVDGLEALRLVVPPEGLESVHESLVASYVQAIAAYDNIIDAFESGDVEALQSAVRENLPEIEQLTAGTRAILLELERVASVNPDDRIESRG